MNLFVQDYKNNNGINLDHIFLFFRQLAERETMRNSSLKLLSGERTLSGLRFTTFKLWICMCVLPGMLLLAENEQIPWSHTLGAALKPYVEYIRRGWWPITKFLDTHVQTFILKEVSTYVLYSPFCRDLVSC